jgi:hypothetical protein
MTMLVTAGLIRGVGLMTRRVRHGGRRGCCVPIQRARIGRHCQLLEQQAEERNERDPGTVAATAKRHGLVDLGSPK